MKDNKKIIFGSLYDVVCFLCLMVLGIILILLCLFSVKFNMKNYDIVFKSRMETGTYYGVKYGEDFEIWKIEKSEDGSLYTKIVYPKK